MLAPMTEATRDLVGDDPMGDPDPTGGQEVAPAAPTATPADSPERARCTAYSRTSGQRCKQPPIAGGTVCVYHGGKAPQVRRDRKSTRLNSSHVAISYAVFCLKKKTLFLLLQYVTSSI